ncbi:MAG: hypothetical protein ACLQVX_25705 [Limisphaerales bacterium]
MRCSDTQCGFKAISRAAARALLPQVKDTGWFFDTELLVRAERSGYRIAELPVVWREDRDTRVRLVSTAWRDFRGLCRLRRELRGGTAGSLQRTEAARRVANAGSTKAMEQTVTSAPSSPAGPPGAVPITASEQRRRERPGTSGGELPSLPLRLALVPGQRAWNPSIAKVEDRIFVAFNLASDSRPSKVRIAQLDGNLRITGDRGVDAGSPSRCAEDMRLFVHEGKLWGVCFQGTVHDDSSGLVVLSFDEDLRVTGRFEPRFGRRPGYEKNWQFFSHQGDMMCVYSVRPHVVLRREADGLREAARGAWGGGLRGRFLGGTPPIEFEGEYLSFFHSWKPWVARGILSWKFLIHPALSLLNQAVGWPFTGAGTWPHRIYSVGAYTFENRPPFRVLRFTPTPLLTAPTGDAHPRFPACVFPGGACWHHGAIVLSYGYHDRECRLAQCSPASLREALAPVRTGGAI